MNLVPTSLDNTNMPPDKSPIPVACGLLALSPPPHPSGEANLMQKEDIARAAPRGDLRASHIFVQKMKVVQKMQSNHLSSKKCELTKPLRLRLHNVGG